MEAALGNGSVAVSLAQRAIDMGSDGPVPFLAYVRSLLVAATAPPSALQAGDVPLPPPPPPVDALLRVRTTMLSMMTVMTFIFWFLWRS